jgi:hypothetical protein
MYGIFSVLSPAGVGITETQMHQVVSMLVYKLCGIDIKTSLIVK